MKKLKIQNSPPKAVPCPSGRRAAWAERCKIVLMVLQILFLILWTKNAAVGDIYAPTDLKQFQIATYDTAYYPTLADADSVQFFFRYNDNSYYDTTITGSITTGIFSRETSVCKWWYDSTGSWGYYAVAHESGKKGAKTWDWTVKAEFDSITNAITDVNKVNFKAEVVKINGGSVGQCTTVINEVNIVSTDTINAEVLDKTGFSLTSDYMTKADSSLYMRTDWGDIKNQNAIVDFNRTHIAYVETVDSINEEITTEVDTSQIKTMNENNLWGASYIWNYETRTLTSGAGSGANVVVIRCKQSSDLSNIALVQLQVLDSVENSTIGLLTSDSQGRGFFALDNGTYCVRMYKPGWQFTVPETLKVSGDEDTTYYADAFDPGSPPQASLCRVYGWIYDVNNQPVVGAKIEASIKTIPLRYQNIIISPYYKNTTTDDEGYWYLDLYPNSALNPSDTKYIFFIYSPSGTILRIKTTVPDQASWELQW
jgi:hypothetical protein